MRLPDRAMSDVKAWVFQGKRAAHRCVEDKPLAACKNCQDEGLVYVSFLGSGPSQQPITMHKPSTYLDLVDGKGWYLIENTTSYECPVCHAMAPQPERVKKAFKDVHRELEEVARQKSFRKDIDDDEF